MRFKVVIIPTLVFILYTIQSFGQGWSHVQRIMDETQMGAYLGTSLDFDGQRLITIEAGRADAITYTWKNNAWNEESLFSIPGKVDSLLSVKINKNAAIIGAPFKDKVFTYTYDGFDWLEGGTIVASDGILGDFFGKSLAMNDDFLIVGAPYDDDSSVNCGSVYIFKKNYLFWLEYQKITASNASSVKNFGSCMAINNDYLIIGSDNSTYIFHWNSTKWIQQAKINIPSNSVDISDSYAIIGNNQDLGVVGMQSGAVSIYKRDGSNWNLQKKIKEPNDPTEFGFGTSVKLDKNRILIGNYGTAYLYELINNSWTESYRLKPSNSPRIDNYANGLFGYNVLLKNNLMFISDPGYGNYSNDPYGSSDIRGALYYYQYKLNQAINFPELLNKKYGDSRYTYTVFSNSGLPVKLRSNNESIAKIVNNEIEIINAGSCEISAVQNGDSIYLPADTVTHALIVNKAPMGIAALNFTKIYGDPNPDFKFAYHDFVNGDDENDIDVPPQTLCSATLASTVGSYPISVSGGIDKNYYFIYYEGELTISKATLKVIAENKSKIYGDFNPSFSINFLGFKNNENSEVINLFPTASSIADNFSNVGNYPILVSGGDDDNYEFNYIPGNLIIEKALLTATAENKVKYYGDANPPLTLTYTGFRNNDNQSKLDLLPSTSCSANEISDVGYYDIVVKNGLDNNYNFSYLNGQLLINKAILSVQAENKSKYFGEPNPEFTLQYSGFKNEDEPSVLDDLPMIFCDADASSLIGNYPIVVSGGSDNNYQFFYINGLLTITGEPTAINSISNNEGLYFYPNPVDDKIQINNASGKILRVTISSLSGEIIRNEIIINQYLELNTLPKGLYILQIDGKRFKLVKR
jgi:hypothetical protein